MPSKQFALVRVQHPPRELASVVYVGKTPGFQFGDRSSILLRGAMKAFVLVLFSIFSGVMVVSSYHPVHSVLWLVFAFLGAAGLFLLYDFGFLALILVIVYVGAIATLFLFVVMMLELSNCSAGGEGVGHYLPVVILVGAAFTSGLLGFKGRFDGPLWLRSSNLEVFGQLVYTEFFYLFLLASFVLLAAMVGAIVLVGELGSSNRAQGLFSQISRLRK